MGDAHPENFGTLVALDGSLGLEPNDFDAADRYPYLWDLRRLTTGLVLAARLAEPGDDQTANRAGDIAREAAASYAQTLAGLSEGAPRTRIVDGGDSAILQDLFRRARRDLARRDELTELTVIEDGVRRLRRGVLDEEDPEELLADLPDFAVDALPKTLGVYRTGLLVEPPARSLEILDAARRQGSGVASWPRIRLLVLVRGPSDAPEDDLILELKELADSGAEGWVPPGRFYPDLGRRVVDAARLAWSRPDAEPWWGASTWLGLPVQIRLEAEAHKTFRVDRQVGADGSVESLMEAGRMMGTLLARVHASRQPGDPDAAAVLGATIAADPEAFADEQALAGRLGADRVRADWLLFRQALVDLGPRLGVPRTLEDEPSPGLRALLGEPAPVRWFWEE